MNPRVMAFTGGVIHTMDTAGTVEAMVVQDGRTTYLGDAAGLKGIVPRTKQIDLGGKTVLPSFFEGHAHPSLVIGKEAGAWLYEENTLEGYQRALKAHLAAHPDLSVLRGSGWQNSVFPVYGPRKEDLDAVSREIPIALYSGDRHALWANSRAIELAGVGPDTPQRFGSTIARDAAGEPSGAFFEEYAMDLILDCLPDFSLDEYKANILQYQDMAHRLGYTGVMDALVTLEGNAMHAYRAFDAEDRLRMYVRGAILIDPQRYAAQLEILTEQAQDLQAGGLFRASVAKFFADGVVECGTAYLQEPYCHLRGHYGAPVWEPAVLRQALRRVAELGFQIHVHSIGDASTRLVLDAFAALPPGLREGRRHALTHLQLVREEDRSRFAELSLIATVNPYWAQREAYFDRIEIPYLGARAERMYPIGSFVRAGVPIASASDYPITLHPDPLYAAEVAVRRVHPGAACYPPLQPGEAISAHDALLSLTHGPAYAYFMEDQTGTLEVGKSADFVILDADPLAVPPEDLSRVRVLETYFRGVRVAGTGTCGESGGSTVSC